MRALLLIVLLLVGACKPEQSTHTSRTLGGVTGTAAKKKKKPASQNATASATNATSSSSTDPANADVDVLDYPTLTFIGKGTISNDGKNYNVIQDMTTPSSEIQIGFNITRFNADGKYTHWEEVDKGVKGETGTITYTLATKAKLKQLEATGFKNVNYLFFTDKITLRNGKTVQLSSPIPVMVIPAPKSRYDSLAMNSALTYIASATDSSGAMAVTSTFKKVSESGNTIGFELTTSVADEQKGAAYDRLGMPKYSSYSVDASTKKLMTIYTDKPFKSKDNRHEHLKVTYKLCSSDLKGKVETFNCR